MDTMEEALKNWRQPSPVNSDDEGSSSSSSGSSGSASSGDYVSEELTPRPEKRKRGEEDEDPTYEPTPPPQKTRSSRVESRVNPEDDTETIRCEIPLVLLRLEFEEQAEESPEASGSTKATKGDKPQRKRGQHGRHQIKKKGQEVISKIGPQGEPLLPVKVIGKFSNQCSCVVREHVPITYENWKNVPKHLKGAVWGEVKSKFVYPEEDYDEDKCMAHCLYIAGKALRNFRSRMNTEFRLKGKTPFEKYRFITEAVWEEFKQQKETEEANAKSKKFKELAAKNTLPHHLGMTGYAAKEKQWRDEERARAQSGEPELYPGLNERSRNYIYARRPKRLKEGKTKFNEPQAEEAEKKLIAVATAEQSGSFNPRREKDQLTEALGNPEHRGRIRGVGSRKSWRTVESWQSDAASYHTRQAYKEGLIQRGRDEAMKDMIMGSLQELATSKDPKMVELRTQMLRQAGSELS